jgi:hypothetical protein
MQKWPDMCGRVLQCLVGCQVRNGYLVYIPYCIVVIIITLILVLAPKVEALLIRVPSQRHRVHETHHRFIVAQLACWAHQVVVLEINFRQ